MTIQEILDLSNYATETRVARRKGGSKATQELFTLENVVKKIFDEFDRKK